MSVYVEGGGGRRGVCECVYEILSICNFVRQCLLFPTRSSEYGKSIWFCVCLQANICKRTKNILRFWICVWVWVWLCMCTPIFCSKSLFLRLSNEVHMFTQINYNFSSVHVACNFCFVKSWWANFESLYEFCFFIFALFFFVFIF